MRLPSTAGRDFGKYFLHGVAFAGLFFFVGLAWAAITVVLVVCGLFIGLAIARIQSYDYSHK